MTCEIILYRPISFDLRAGATAADIHRLEMNHDQAVGANRLTAYISVAGQTEFVKIAFSHVHLFRIVDEMHLPLEESDRPQVGHVSNHFAYQVEGSPFWRAQREVFESVLPGPVHYRFVTGGSCLDVISGDQPEMSWAHAIQE